MASKKAFAIVGGVAIGAGLYALSKRGKSMPRQASFTDVAISKFFRLSEFLQSKAIPSLKNYLPNAVEIANVKALALDVLDPARQEFGPIAINNGGRPESVAVAAGTTWNEALKKAGYAPAKNSDHGDFSAADIYFTDLPPVRWIAAYAHFVANPKVRQVILYFKHDKSGKIVPQHFHVAVVRPGKPAFLSDKRFFVELDNKRLEKAPNVA